MAERDDMDLDQAPVTRRELREEIAKLATKEDLERFVTKDEFHAGLETWAGALEARLEAKFDAKFALLHADLARHTQAIIEAFTTQVRALDDKYNDLPPRVAKLEDIEARRAARRRGPRQS
jgi:hypothetical protein